MKKLLNLILFAFLFTASTLLAQNTEPIRIGVFLDMSGQTSAFGIASYNGINMAVTEINEAGGVNGRKLVTFLVDDFGRPETARDAAQKLIDQHKVHVLIGEVASTNSLAAGYVAQNNKVVMISPSSTNLRVTQIGDYVFRACFVDPVQGEAMAKFAYNNLELRRIAVFSDSMSDYSKFLASNFRKTFAALGGKISSEQEYSQVDADFKIQLRAIRKTRPDALYLPGYYGQVAIIAKQSRRMGLRIPLLGGDGWDSPDLWKLGGNALRNSYMTSHFSAGDPAPPVTDFLKKYRSEYQFEADGLAALGYDSVYLLAGALRSANSSDASPLRDALAATTNFQGVTGRLVRFTLARNPIKPVTIVKSDPGNSTFVYQTTIQP